MILDRTTYEAWLLDRMEGNLTPEQERQLEAFLLANPDLSAELGGASEDAFSGAEKVPFEDKGSLKRHLPPQGSPNEQTIGDFLIGLHEGDLSREQEEAVRMFMAAHPRSQHEAKLIALARATGKDTVFEGKEKLLRMFPPQGLPDAHRLDDFLVARMEGDLALQQRVALDKLIASDANAAKQWALMSRTVVQRETIVFEEKDQLKKKEVRVIPIGGGGWMRLAAAASIALVMGLGWAIFKQNTGPDPVGPGIANDQPASPKKQQQPAEKNEGAAASVDPGNEEKEPGTLKNDGHPQQAAPRKAVAPDRKMEGHDPAPQRVAPERLSESDEPMLAQAQRPVLERDPLRPEPVGVAPTTGPAPAPLEEALAVAPEPMTIGQVLTGAMRREVLGQPGMEQRALDGNDAIAAIDKGLGAISGDRAGLEAQRTTSRSRFRLQLGGLAVSASKGR